MGPNWSKNHFIFIPINKCKVNLEFGEVDIQSAIEAKRSSDGRDNLKIIVIIGFNFGNLIEMSTPY